MEKYRIDAVEQIMCDFVESGVHNVYIPTMITVLKEKVSLAALTYAVKAAVAFHPYFATRLVKEGVTFYWQENTRTPVILEKQIFESFTYGDKSNHFFPWAITYFDHMIYCDISHELVDGGGAWTFLATLMEYYTRYVSGDMSQIEEKTTREERLESEAALPTEIAYQKGVQALYQPKKEDVSIFCPEMMGANAHVKIFSIDAKTIRQISFGYDASPFALIAPLLARASIPYLAGENKIVKLVIPQNVRYYFDSRAFHNFIESHQFYYYDDKMRNMSMEQVSTIFRGRLDLLSDISNIKASFSSKYEMGQYINVPEAREQVKRKFEERVYEQTTIGYTHMTHPGISENASEYIANIYFNFSGDEPMIVCTGINFGADINLTISTKFVDDGFFKSICEQLDKLNVGYSMRDAEAAGERIFVFNDDPEC